MIRTVLLASDCLRYWSYFSFHNFDAKSIKLSDSIPDMLGFVKFSFELVDLSNDVSHSCELRVCFGNAVDCAESVVRTCGYSFCLVL